MIRLSRLADYAVVILNAFPHTGDRLVSASEISALTKLPEPTVAKVLKLLAKGGVGGGILTSVRGAAGGYKLARSRDKISVAAIIEAVDGPIALTACVKGQHDDCDFETTCSMKGRWDGVNAVIVEALKDVTLADMVQNITSEKKRA